MVYAAYLDKGENRTYVPVQLDNGGVMTYWVWWPRIDDLYTPFQTVTEMQYYAEEDL